MAWDNGFWRGRNVLVTGHTGFKGSWMSLWLASLGARVTGISLAPNSTPSLWSIVGEKTGVTSHIADIRDEREMETLIAAARPEIVFHMAAQALVRHSYRDPIGTYATNVLGTAHVLNALRTPGTREGLKAVLVVTSDKVYENNGEGRAFTEADPLGGHDPYSNSKACTELVVSSLRASYFQDGPALVTARAGNVIGGGDWSEDRLIPDAVRALQAGESLSLRYPGATRPWQHVLEPLGGYLLYAQSIAQGKGLPKALNFGPRPESTCTVSEVIDRLRKFLGEVDWVQAPGQFPAEATSLTLSSALAERSLGWVPRLGIERTLDWTGSWYRAHQQGQDMLFFTQDQISQYEGLMRDGVAA